jgi:hypothetical protein
MCFLRDREGILIDYSEGIIQKLKNGYSLTLDVHLGNLMQQLTVL